LEKENGNWIIKEEMRSSISEVLDFDVILPLATVNFLAGL
jgi:hypothetical protein